MAASFSALVVLVLLYRVGQAANLARVHEPVQSDGTSKDARLNKITLDTFSWTYSAIGGKTILTVCTVEPFGGLGQTVKQVTLLTTIGDEPVNNCEGVFDENGGKCATFPGPGTGICAVDVPSGLVQYTLNVDVDAVPRTEVNSAVDIPSGNVQHDLNVDVDVVPRTEVKSAVNIPSGLVQYPFNVDVDVVPLTEVNKVGTASFTMTVDAATLTCGTTKFIRATGTTNTVIPECVALGIDGVCYKKGDLYIDPLCFTVTDSVPATLTLCLKGDNHVIFTTDGELAITELAYKPAVSATLALTHLASASVGFDAIVLREQAPLHSCVVSPVVDGSGTCIIPNFTADHAEYEVCTILPTARGFQTAVSSITDLNVQAGEDEQFLQFRFTNANPDKNYVAKLFIDPSVDPASASVNIDCTGVPQDHICYGFLDKSITATVLTIEYLAADGTTSNRIAITNPGFPIL